MIFSLSLRSSQLGRKCQFGSHHFTIGNRHKTALAPVTERLCMVQDYRFRTWESKCTVDKEALTKMAAI